MTLGHYPESLVIGYLRNQGFINSLDELGSVQVDWDTNLQQSKLLMVLISLKISLHTKLLPRDVDKEPHLAGYGMN